MPLKVDDVFTHEEEMTTGVGVLCCATKHNAP
jgi:hypothetical protein